MDNWLNYHHLFYFREIAREGSIAAAARKLRLGHATLSAQLKQLEEKLQMTFFERHHKKLVLTEAGRVALEYAEEIFDLGSEMVEALQDRITPTRTHIQLGALDSVPKHLIFEVVSACYRETDALVSVLEGTDDELLRQLLTFKIDLMFTNHVPSVKVSEKFQVRSLGKLNVVVCGAPQYRGLRKDFPRSLNRAPLVLPTFHSRLRHGIAQYMKNIEVSPDVVGETQDTSLQKIMGVNGVGLIPLPKVAVKPFLEKGELIEIGELDGVYEELFLVKVERKVENPIAEHLFKEFKLDGASR